MSDIIYYKNGEETFRIPFPTPETKLEIKMTEQKITLELTLEELKLIDKHLLISVATKSILEKIKNAYPKPDVIEVDGVKYQRIEEPTKPMDEVVERLTKKYQAPNGDFLKNYPDVTRVEVITDEGREFVRYECSNVQVSLQDDGQTIKVFLFSTYD